ncbi:MAG: peptidoglycan recognition protein family protein [Candidatus Scalindua sp.]|nr:peptidoglycan recognition protein family protein [Candidatus Scalindua sp.]
MKITERHVRIVAIVKFAIAIGLFIALPFIGMKKIVTVVIDIEELCSVEVEENSWRQIVIHHSATNSGDAQAFDKYHREKKKWANGLAYHFVIGNGSGSKDGKIEVGERWTKQIHGAHTANMDTNRIAIGICLVGNFEEEQVPTQKQITSLVSLINYLSNRYQIPKSNIIGHNQVAQKSTACPGKNFPIETILNRISLFQVQASRMHTGKQQPHHLQ